MATVNIEDYSWIARGKQRRKIIAVMYKLRTPTELKEEVKLTLANVSRVLRDLEKRKLAMCLNPKAITGRVYELTPQGKIIRDKLLEREKRS
jgi:DNA-binding MarR family transcriptional regulator